MLLNVLKCRGQCPTTKMSVVSRVRNSGVVVARRAPQTACNSSPALLEHAA